MTEKMSAITSMPNIFGDKNTTLRGKLHECVHRISNINAIDTRTNYLVLIQVPYIYKYIKKN